ncbi:Atu4866 domain-containing protein [Qaidamihabitans albus]|uniref:Atu4866 domain-containing protein n=1 Tax=Qaidamihabitans albus TaxID=2795733 RepID=UPI001F2B4DA1|nr:Atu4866 domain-containing protein [Qaidamihabitans albus]
MTSRAHQHSEALSTTLLAAEADPDRAILLTGATVVTMDPTLGTLDGADLLIRGDRIADVGHGLHAPDAIVVDVTGSVVAPGFVDTHRHAWQAQMRRTIPDVDDLAGYLTSTLATAYSPHDMYVGTRLAALTALDCGITTMLDFSHNSRTSEHSDAAVTALLDTGIRGVHAAMGPHFGSWDQQWPADLARLKTTYFSSDDRLVTLRLAALATPDIAGPRLAYGPDLARVAADLDIGVSLDVMFGTAASEAILRWQRAGLLGPHLESIHSTALSADAWSAMRDAGVTVSLAPTSDTQIGLEDAVPPVDEALAHGIHPGLSVDVEVALASDMFTQMRTLLSVQRMRAVHATYGTGAEPVRITTSDVLDFATLSGARTLGLDGVTGSLTPGKRADLIVVDAEDLNTMPLHDPVGTLVLGAERSNITSVWVAGRLRKWDRRLVGVDIAALRDQVHASVESIATRLAGPTGGDHPMTPRPGTLVVRDALVHITPSRTTRADIVVTDGTVTHVGTRRLPAQPDAVTIAAAGASAVPLLVDSAVHARPPHDRHLDDLAPGNRAAFAVIRGAVRENRIRHMLVVSPRDLLAVVVGEQVEARHGVPTRPSADPGDGWAGAWTDPNRGMTQFLTSHGRYSETRGGRADAYTGRYWVHEDRITYLDDQGFWAFGQQVNGILHHAGYVLHRTTDGDPRGGGR